METKRQPTIETAVIDGVLRLTFSHGEVLEINPAELTPEIVEAATLHGLKQKLVDAAAISRNTETGRSATVEDKFAAVREVCLRLKAGLWNALREGGGGGGGLLFRALCRVYPEKSPETLTAFLAARTDAQKAALRKNPKIASAIDALRAETGKSSAIDTDELLGELE